nr:transglycosylase SLT domain-containing protein [Roseomonas acroporae]
MSEAGPAMATDNPRSACLNAARAAEREYDLPHGLLVAVALAESGLHAYALNLGGRTHVPASFAEARRLLQNNRGRSAMIGCVQVNAAAHARGGQDWPLDPVVATEWAARTLRFRYEQTGDWGQALHIWQTGRNGGQGATPGICRVRAKLDVVAPNSDLFSDRNCGGMQTARIRRSGRALLELAEAPDR